MSVINCRCGKPLKSGMEVEYSAWLNEFFCSPDCAQDRYLGPYPELTKKNVVEMLPASPRQRHSSRDKRRAGAAGLYTIFAAHAKAAPATRSGLLFF